MTDRDLLELIANQVGTLTDQVGTLTDQVGTLTDQVGTLTKDMTEVKTRLTSVENTVTRIENTHGEKLSALFDGYKHNSEKLDRIEQEVSKHEEVILRRLG